MALFGKLMYEDGSSTIYKTFTDGSNDQEERNADDEVISYIKMDVDGQILESKEYDEFGCILWKKNGVIVQRVEYVDGMKVVHSYDESGKIKYSSGFINYARYDVGIQVKYTAYFDNEKVNYEIFFDAEGNIKKEIMYNEDGSFVVTEY